MDFTSWDMERLVFLAVAGAFFIGLVTGGGIVAMFGRQ